MLVLRDYQEAMIQQTRDAMRQHKSVLLQAPTGAGKTAITVFMMSRAAEQGKRAMFIVHQNELLTQTSRALWRQKLEHGTIASGRIISQLPVQVASVQSLVNRLHLLKAPDLIIIDESHRAAASTYKKVLDYWPNARVIGLTATPQRTDGKGLDDLFDCIVKGPSIRWLMEQGYLSDYEIYAPKLVHDLSSIKISMGDFSKSDAEKVIDKPKITGDAVDHYLKIAKGKRCVVMCVTIKHAEHVCDQYIAAGIPAAQIDGVMSAAERQKVLSEFAAGKILVICNVQLLIEGVDIPSIEVVQWLRPTQSLIVFMQGNGRGLRPADGKEKLIVLDHVGNIERHGMLCDDRQWSLEGKKAGKRKKKDEAPDVNIQQCKHCYAVFRPGPEICPYCGKPIEKKAARKLEEVDGELVKLDMERFRKEQRREQGSARTLRDLVALGMRRGMAKASQWAAITMSAREGRKPTPAEFNEARRIQQELSQ